jgi:hypothetical protein
MRVSLAAAVLLLASCAKSEQPATDTPAAAASAALADADFSGTWVGTAKLEGTDSVFLHWTQVCNAGTCTGTTQEAPDTVSSTYTIDADSAHGVSQPFADPTAGGVRVIDHWISRPKGASITGHGWSTLADKPDSVVMRYTFEGTRKP